MQWLVLIMNLTGSRLKLLGMSVTRLDRLSQEALLNVGGAISQAGAPDWVSGELSTSIHLPLPPVCRCTMTSCTRLGSRIPNCVLGPQGQNRKLPAWATYPSTTQLGLWIFRASPSQLRMIQQMNLTKLDLPAQKVRGDLAHSAAINRVSAKVT